MTGRELIKKILESGSDLDEQIEITLQDMRDHREHTEIINYPVSSVQDDTIYIRAEQGRIDGEKYNAIVNLDNLTIEGKYEQKNR